MGKVFIERRPEQTSSLRTTARHFVNARRGGRPDFEHLVKRIGPRLYRFCLFLTGNPEQARDLSQEAYVRLLENMNSLHEPKYFLTWLFKTTKNVFLNHIRSPKNRPHRDWKSVSSRLFSKTQDESSFAVLEVLSTLTSEDRLLFLMAHLEGCSYEEISESLGISLSLVRGRLYRIRTCLRLDLVTKTHVS